MLRIKLNQLMLASIVISLLSSCVAMIVSPNHQPAEISLDRSPAYHVQLVNRFDVNFLDYKQKNKNEVIADGAQSQMENLKKLLENNQQFQVKDEIIDLKGEMLIEFGSILDQETIKSLCRKNESDYLIVQEFFNPYFSQDMDVVKNPDGTKDRTANYDLVLIVGLTVYDSAGHTRFRQPIRKQMMYNQRQVVSGLLAAGPSMGNAGNQVNALVMQVNQEFMTKFYPSDAATLQYYYVGKPFNQAAHYMNKKDWNHAIEALQPLTEHKKKNVKGKACYNLSICYAFLEDFEEADQWYVQAKEILGNKLSYKAIDKGLVFQD